MDRGRQMTRSPLVFCLPAIHLSVESWLGPLARTPTASVAVTCWSTAVLAPLQGCPSVLLLLPVSSYVHCISVVFWGKKCWIWCLRRAFNREDALGMRKPGAGLFFFHIYSKAILL